MIILSMPVMSTEKDSAGAEQISSMESHSELKCLMWAPTVKRITAASHFRHRKSHIVRSGTLRLVPAGVATESPQAKSHPNRRSRPGVSSASPHS